MKMFTISQHFVKKIVARGVLAFPDVLDLSGWRRRVGCGLTGRAGQVSHARAPRATGRRRRSFRLTNTDATNPAHMVYVGLDCVLDFQWVTTGLGSVALPVFRVSRGITPWRVAATQLAHWHPRSAASWTGRLFRVHPGTAAPNLTHPAVMAAIRRLEGPGIAQQTSSGTYGRQCTYARQLGRLVVDATGTMIVRDPS
jgi:hypothetical protein